MAHRVRAALIAIAVSIGACVAPAPSVHPSVAPATSVHPTGAPSPGPVRSPAGTSPPDPGPSFGPTRPGRPYDADQIEALMAARAPVAFPDQLRTRAVAEVLADRVWSFDGRPYETVWFGGSCEGARCEFSFEGQPTFALTLDTVDAYALVLDARTGVFSEEGGTTLRGFPPDAIPDLEALARSLDADGRYRDRALLSVDWAIPPPDDVFVLRFGNGGEEGDPTFLVRLSASERQILSITLT